MRQYELFLAVAAAVSLLAFAGCEKKKSVVTITDAWGKGAADGTSTLQFAVTMENRSGIGAVITDFLIEINEDGQTVLAVIKDGDAEFQRQINPDTRSMYRVEANAAFTVAIDCTRSQDIYGGRNPNLLNVTLYVEDDGGAYTVLHSTTFDFKRDGSPAKSRLHGEAAWPKPRVKSSGAR